MIIVLVGSPFSGKTTLLNKLKNKGIKVFHSDSFVSEIYQKDREGYKTIVNEFGYDYVNDKGVDKTKLKELIIRKPETLIRINEIIHPIIFNYLEGKDDYVAELPIVTTSPIKFKYDKIVLIKAEENTLLERLNNSNKKNDIFAKKMIKKWRNIEDKINFDLVINTSFEDGVDKIIKEFDND